MPGRLRSLFAAAARRPVLAAAALLAALLATAAGWAVWRFTSDGADDHLRAARAALDRRDFARAYDELTAYRTLRPRDVDACFLAARTARRAGKYEDAERLLEECQRLGGVTDADRLEWDLLHVQQGDLARVNALKASIRPDHPDALLVLEAMARGFRKAERLRDAAEALDLWLSRQPDSVLALTWRGQIWERLSQRDDALRDYRRAAELDGDDVDARLGQARCLERDRHYAEAAEQYEEARRRRPDDAQALVGLARCRHDLSEDDEAAPLLDAALARDPDNADALAERGKIELAKGRLTEAERLLRAALRLSPDDREARLRLAECLRRQERTAEAEAELVRLADVEADLNRMDKLIRAVAEKPGDADLRCEAGRIAFRLGNDAEGVRWLDGALAASPQHPGVHAAFAEYYERTGRPREAAEHRRLARP
jgi:tetratricopeptide (TPR) repeat protein